LQEFDARVCKFRRNHPDGAVFSDSHENAWREQNFGPAVTRREHIAGV
jgi:hypothetical protein